MISKLAAGSPMPTFALPAVDGGEVRIGGTDRWQMTVVYRGKHCPICKSYLDTLDGLRDDFEKLDTDVVAISSDPKDRAEAQVSEQGLRLRVGYDLTIPQMRALGLYVSEPRNEQETDRPFAEPGLFVVNPEGKVQIVDISNAPFARPDLAGIARGLAFIREKGYPIRGTYA